VKEKDTASKPSTAVTENIPVSRSGIPKRENNMKAQNKRVLQSATTYTTK
jgi:hypothetical protein